MHSTVIHLGLFDLLIASMLVAGSALISIRLKLGLEKSLSIAALRCVVQLGMVGFVLQKVFGIHHPLPVILWLLLMLVMAGREAVRRSKWYYGGIRIDTMLTMAFSAFTVGTIVTQAVVGTTPWYDPQYVIPVLGMIFGNSLNGISLCLDRFLEHVSARRHEIELMLTYGATRAEALSAPLREAVRTGMIPIINNMSVAGLVSLPGMMTGQILAGSPPFDAVKYQMVVMFMISAANALGSMSVSLLASRRLMGPSGILELDILTRRTS